MKKEHKAFILGMVITGSLLGMAWFIADYVKSHVPEFVRMHGPKYILHYLQGKDAYDEIYEKIGVGSRKNG